MFFENMINHSIESLQQFAKIGHLTFQLAAKHGRGYASKNYLT